MVVRIKFRKHMCPLEEDFDGEIIYNNGLQLHDNKTNHRKREE